MHVILKMHSIDLEKTLLSRQKLDHKHIKSYSSTQNPAHPNQTTVSKFLGSPFPTSFGAVEHILELFQVIASPLQCYTSSYVRTISAYNLKARLYPT